MKWQLVILILITAALFYKKRPRWFIACGISFIVISIPLFMMQKALYSAQQLVIFSGLFFLIATIWYIVRLRSTK